MQQRNWESVGEKKHNQSIICKLINFQGSSTFQHNVHSWCSRRYRLSIRLFVYSNIAIHNQKECILLIIIHPSLQNWTSSFVVECRNRLCSTQNAKCKEEKQKKLTAPIVPRRSPNPVLDRLDEVYLLWSDGNRSFPHDMAVSRKLLLTSLQQQHDDGYFAKTAVRQSETNPIA